LIGEECKFTWFGRGSVDIAQKGHVKRWVVREVLVDIFLSVAWQTAFSLLSAA
jgi:hypothetical protein